MNPDAGLSKIHLNLLIVSNVSDGIPYQSKIRRLCKI